MQRRDVLAGGVGAAGALAAGRAFADALRLSPGLPPGLRTEAQLDALPGKQKLIKLSWRPPNYETPVAAFDTTITPNEWFFVRYHLADIPEMGRLGDWSLKVGGDAAERAVSIDLETLRREFEPVEVTAVCQCSGNRRGLSDPHVAGVQWGYGAMGNARWRGARLKDVLARAGVKDGAVELALDGADGPVLPATPDFRKSLPIEKAMEDTVLLAYEMNGAALPHLNGFPVRVVVPGWTGTYWMKHVNALEIRSKPLETFWMRPAYRVPTGMFPVAHPFLSQQDEKTTPITEIVVNSLITNLADGTPVASAGFDVKGIAWDGGSGIRDVAISIDGGRTWKPAELGADAGRFSFRPFGFRATPEAAGSVTVMARATANSGAMQVDKLLFNPAGYQNNVVQRITMNAA